MTTYNNAAPVDEIFSSGAPISGFNVTNWAEDYSLVCGTDDAALGNVLGTLIKVLVQRGLIPGTVATP